MTPKLSQLAELLRQLAVRNFYKKTREFLTSRGIAVGSGWSGVQTAILAQEHAAGFDDFLIAFETFVRDAVLVSHKRAYILTGDVSGPESLVPPLPAGDRRDYLAAEVPSLCGQQGAFFLEHRSLPGVEIYTYVTSRPARKIEEIDPSSLRPEARAQFGAAKLVARYEVNVRCYDHIIKTEDVALLLIDAPEGIDSATLSKDEINYAVLLDEEQQLGETRQPPYVDLFPAVERFWRAEQEGIVNWLEFVSNKRAQITGRFSPTSKENYRDHEFQRAGEKAGAQVSPYKIAVKYMDRPGEPVVVLPGRAEMVLAGTLGAEGATRVGLFHMLIPGYTEWHNFVFLLGRVRIYIGPEDPA